MGKIGFGLEKLYLNNLYPENVLNVILSTKQFESSLNSFWGKIIIYTYNPSYYIFFSIYIYVLIGLAPFQSREL
ncbi:MAG: hypothetical protein DRP29_05720 [Thermodesulfobacteriota bacterium]|nr:MAG: hypothetical protein DRP29_05720 [Thermodesulfobacteriota bacterium]